MMAAGGAQLRKILGDDRIVVWKFHVDWKDPARTKVIGPEKIAVAPYRYLCGGQLTSCVTQPGTERRLDAQATRSCSGSSTGTRVVMSRSSPSIRSTRRPAV